MLNEDAQGNVFTSPEKRDTVGLKTREIALCHLPESLYNVQGLIRLAEFSPFPFTGNLNVINVATGVAEFSSRISPWTL